MKIENKETAGGKRKRFLFNLSAFAKGRGNLAFNYRRVENVI